MKKFLVLVVALLIFNLNMAHISAENYEDTVTINAPSGGTTWYNSFTADMKEGETVYISITTKNISYSSAVYFYIFSQNEHSKWTGYNQVAASPEVKIDLYNNNLINYTWKARKTDKYYFIVINGSQQAITYTYNYDFSSSSSSNSNKYPIADAGSNKTINLGESIDFSGSKSSDPDGYIIGYSWNFGDGSTGSGKNVTHKYTSAGSYTVKLTVTDNSGLKNIDTITITVKSNSSELSNNWISKSLITGYINEYRKSKGLSSLTRNDEADKYAQEWADYCKNNNIYGSKAKDGSKDLDFRFDQYGYSHGWESWNIKYDTELLEYQNKHPADFINYLISSDSDKIDEGLLYKDGRYLGIGIVKIAKGTKLLNTETNKEFTLTSDAYLYVFHIINEFETVSQTPSPTTSSSNNNALIAGGGLFLLILIGAIAVSKSKNKTEGPNDDKTSIYGENKDGVPEEQKTQIYSEPGEAEATTSESTTQIYGDSEGTVSSDTTVVTEDTFVEPETPVCANCGAEIKENWVRCPQCMEFIKKSCPKCGSEIQSGWKACPSCGEKL